jgi:hypothetical protein
VINLWLRHNNPKTISNGVNVKPHAISSRTAGSVDLGNPVLSVVSKLGLIVILFPDLPN